jgi:hypothetical protein
MAFRSTRVILQNRILSNRALVKTSEQLDHGTWTDQPPDFVGNRAEWGSESGDFTILTGTEGRVTYNITGPQLTHILTLNLHWNNPAVGGNTYHASVTPVGQADGSGFSVGFFGEKRFNKEDQAEVTFVLLSGKCVVNENTGEFACTIHSHLEASSQRYAAIWEQRSGPSWQARHGLDAAQYQQAFDELLSQGFRLVQVSGYSTHV